MKRKVHIKTWGCQMNEYDSDKILALLSEALQYQSTDEPEEADLLLLNTCSIREKAQEKLFHQLGRWRALKRIKPGLMIGVGGCVASQEGAQLRARAPYVDFVFGPQTFHRLPAMIEAFSHKAQPIIDVSFPKIEKFDCLPEPQAKGPTAYVSIMEGCDNYCTYCVVPYTRGPEVSRPVDDVLLELTQLAEQGVREVTLLGQNVNAYRGAVHGGKECSFADLLRLAAAVDGIGRIRFMTSHPMEFTDDLINVYAELPQLVSFLHLPVQSGSDAILAAMHRGHTVAMYRAILNKLQAIRPHMRFSSDFIVGFPNETEAQFEETLQLIEAVKMDLSYSFIFSPRPGTPASTMEDSVPLAVKGERLQRLQSLIQRQAEQYNLDMLGKEEEILVEGPSKKYPLSLTGRTETNRQVHFEGNDALIGNFVKLRITETYRSSLNGVLSTS